jgi:CSLREA domain-containing protein
MGAARNTRVSRELKRSSQFRKPDLFDHVSEGASIMIRAVSRFTPALLLALAVPASAAVYTPNKTTDSDDGSCTAADCSLREAIAAANQNAGDDVILLHAGIYTAANLQIQSNVILIGDGAGRTVIDGGGAGLILTIPGGTVQIQDVTLRNGRGQGAGGAIRNHGHLTLLRTTLSGNTTVAGAAGAGFGGAILTDGLESSLDLIDSAVVSNTSQSGGGGIALGGTFNLVNVTISGNRSQTDFGGGLYIFSDAHGSVNNATIAGNTAALKGGGVFIESSAFVGISPSVTNSILAGNTASSEPDCSGAIESGYDLIGNGAGCILPAGQHDKVGTALAPIDPKLGALGANGGPTPTQPLLAGSPALDAGNPATPGSGDGTCAATDQRGARRPGGPACDMGAYEKTTSCVAGGGTLCLGNGRFSVTATFQAPGGAASAAQGVTLTSDSGYFWFFDPANVEVTVKVLNGCGVNNKYWVFAAGMTNVNVVLTVTDTVSGQVRTYTNPQGRTFRSILDTSAFATCGAP